MHCLTNSKFYLYPSYVLFHMINFSQHEVEQLKKDNDQIRAELDELKKPIDGQHIEIQTDEE
jgi:hypothetical protein